MSSTTGKNKIALDAYYTPAALAVACVSTLPMYALCRAWEPHVGGGAFARALYDRGARVFMSDIDAGAPALNTESLTNLCPERMQADALQGWPFQGRRPHWVVGNPPFTNVEAHIESALNAAEVGVGFLMRLAVLEGQKRKTAWRHWPLASVHVLVERPSFTGGGTDSAAYGFFRFEHGYAGQPTLNWLSWR